MKSAKRPYGKTILVILATLFFVAAGFAQQQDSRERIQRTFRLLERKIEQVRQMAQRYQNDVALSLLNEAESGLQRAKDLLREEPPRFFQARQQLMQANALADRAARLVLLKPAANLKNELEQLIQRLEQLSGRSDNSDLFYFLNKARAFKQQAEQAFERGEYLRGHELMRVARHFADKGISLFSDARGNSPQRFEQYFSGLTTLYGRAESLVEENDQASELLQEAGQYLQQARNLYGGNQQRQALSMMRIAERLLYRVIDMAQNEGMGGRERLENNLQSLQRYVRSLSDDVGEDGQPRQLLTKSEQLLQKAENSLRDGDLTQARLNLDLAQKVAQKAFRLNQDDRSVADDSALNAQLNDIERFLTLQKNQLQQLSDAQLDMLHEQAGHFFRNAQQAVSGGNPRRASIMINLSLQTLNHVEKMRKIQKPQKPDQQSVENELSRLETIVSRLSQNNELDEMQQARLESAGEMLAQAREESRKGNWSLVQELNRLVRDQIERIVR